VIPSVSPLFLSLKKTFSCLQQSRQIGEYQHRAVHESVLRGTRRHSLHFSRSIQHNGEASPKLQFHNSCLNARPLFRQAGLLSRYSFCGFLFDGSFHRPHSSTSGILLVQRSSLLSDPARVLPPMLQKRNPAESGRFSWFHQIRSCQTREGFRGSFSTNIRLPGVHVLLMLS
jgi:hypothetical protein